MKKVFISYPRNVNSEGSVGQEYIYYKQALDSGFIPITPYIVLPEFMVDIDGKRDIDTVKSLVGLCSEMWVFGTPTDYMLLEISKAEEIGILVKFKSLTPQLITGRNEGNEGKE